jgi:hypothetical protein
MGLFQGEIYVTHRRKPNSDRNRKTLLPQVSFEGRCKNFGVIERHLSVTLDRFEEKV